jgi:hypothetical protein
MVEIIDSLQEYDTHQATKSVYTTLPNIAPKKNIVILKSNISPPNAIAITIP